MHIDRQLTWNDHGKIVADKLCKNIFVLRHLYNQLPLETLRVAYFALIQAQLSYGLLIWGHSSSRHRIFGLQRKAVRVLGGLKYRDDCKHHFKRFKIMTLPSLYIFHCLIYVKSNLTVYKTHRDVHT